MAIAADDEALPTTPLQAELRRLLEAMEPLEELESKCDDLKEQLTDELPASRLGDVLEATIDLLIEALDQQKKEHEHWKTFVCRLNDRLCELNKSMQNTEQQMLSSYYGGRKVEAELERHVDDIATKLHSATSVEQLKAHVHQRVSVIRARLKDSQGKAAQQFTDLQAQLNKLSASIQQLERESAELRGRHEQGQPLIDPLTGIANRFAFEERLQEEIARSKRYGSPLVAQLWQVDDFESLRRGFGRKVGKKALQLIAQILSTQLRQTDYIAHYENETFAVLLPETPLDGAQWMADRLCRAIASSEFHHRGERVGITISCGYTGIQKEDTVEAVLQRAQVALKQATGSGRGRYCVG